MHGFRIKNPLFFVQRSGGNHSPIFPPVRTGWNIFKAIIYFGSSLSLFAVNINNYHRELCRLNHLGEPQSRQGRRRPFPFAVDGTVILKVFANKRIDKLQTINVDSKHRDHLLPLVLYAARLISFG